jgi:general secretion pathway protein A
VRHRTALVLGLGLAAGAGLYAAASRVTQDDPSLAPVTAKVPARAAQAASMSRVASAPIGGASGAAAAATAASASFASSPAPKQPPKLLRDRDEAWRELASLWKVEVPEGNACAELAKQQLQCFDKNLNLALIRELGRPGIVTLDARQGTPSYALLTALTQDSATLRAAGTEQTVTLAALATRWNGEFATLWKAPPGYSPRTDPRGETADWIGSRLAAADGQPAEAHGTVDTAIKARLRAFQLAHGLPADGQPGPMTFMQLNRTGGADEPRLASRN